MRKTIQQLKIDSDTVTMSWHSEKAPPKLKEYLKDKAIINHPIDRSFKLLGNINVKLAKSKDFIIGCLNLMVRSCNKFNIVCIRR